MEHLIALSNLFTNSVLDMTPKESQSENRTLLNEESMVRLMGATLMDVHEKWAKGNKYFTVGKYYVKRDSAKKRQKKVARHLHIVS